MTLTREAAAAAVLAVLLPGAAFAQQQPAAPVPADSANASAPAATPATTPAASAAIPAALPATTDAVLPPEVALPPQDQEPATDMQPGASTPPTPFPTRAADPKVTGITSKQVLPANMFNTRQVPGQPLPGDPTVLRTLQDAINVALSRSPAVLAAQESVLNTDATVGEIVALRNPQVSAGGTYARLANDSSSATVPVSVTPSSASNPFGVGLNGTTPPGSSPIQLSTVTGTTGGVGTTSTTAGTTTSTAAPVSSAPEAATTATTTSVSEAAPASGGAASAVESAARPAAETLAAISSHQTGTGTGTGTTTTTTPTITPTVNTVTENLNQVSAHVSVSELIDLTGIFRAAIQLGDLEKALSRIELAGARQQTVLTVTNAYYSVLKAMALVRVNEASVADSEELFRVTQVELRAGVAAEFDVLQAQTQLENGRQALISSRNQVQISKNYLSNLIGLDPSTPVDPQQVAVPPIPTLDEEALIQQAFKQRPEYLEADVSILISQKNTRLAHRNLEPYLAVGATGGYDATPDGSTQSKTTASVGVSLNVPIWDGGQTRAAIQAAQSDERTALVTKDEFARGVKSEVQQSIVAIRDGDYRSREIAATVGEAREALRLANVRLRAGVGTELDVFTAEATLVQAEDNQVGALYDYLGALASLSRAVGTPE